MKFIRIIFESGINNRPPGTKLRRSGTKGHRRPGTTHDCVNLGLRSLRTPGTGHFVDGGKYESVVVVRNIKHV